MKGIFGLLGLLLALAVVGVLVKKQLAASGQGLPVLQAPVPASTDGAGAPPVQSQPVQEQYKQALEAAVQAPRAMPDDK